MTRSLRPRIAVGLLLAMLAVLSWLLLSQDRRAAELTSGTHTSDHAELSEAKIAATSTARTADSGLTRSKVTDDEADEAGVLDAASGPPVHLRVLLRVYDEEGEERIPARCAGWVVRAQSWLSESGEVVPHEAVADAQGVAEFTFPGEVHVDWAGCLPPPASGFGFSQVSHHQDFDDGDQEEWTVIMQPKGGARGLVLTLDDQPLGGAEVHAFDPSWSSGFEDWSPGFLITRSAADGSFEFGSLSEGEWSFAVAPGEHLQFDPMLGDVEEGKGRAQITAGETADAGVLRVIAAAEQIVRVTDSDGNGVPHLSFTIAARSFVSPRLRPQEIYFEDVDLEVAVEDHEPSLMNRFLSGEDPDAWITPPSADSTEEIKDERVDWPYDGLTRETGADGSARWQLPQGRYAVECWSSVPGMPEGRIAPFEIVVPGAPVLIRVPIRHSSWYGSVVDDVGMPVDSASVSLHWQDENGESWSDAVDADANGAFRFNAVPQLRDCEMEISSGGHVSTSWRVSLLELPTAPYCLPRGGLLNVVFRGPEGIALQLGSARVSLRPLRVEVAAPAPGSIGGESRGLDDYFDYSLIQNQLHAYQLPRGSYELTLILQNFSQLNFFSPDFSPSVVAFTGNLRLGYSISRSQSSTAVEIGHWTVETGSQTQVITLSPEQCAILDPPIVRHAGVVLDAESGRPVSGAYVQASSLNLVHSVTTDAEGRFAMEIAAAACEFEIRANGYEVLSGLQSQASGAEREQEFRLRSSGADIHLRILDRDGRRLPPCTLDLLFPGVAGAFPPADAQQGIAGLSLLHGEVLLQSRTAGLHRLRLSFAPGVQVETNFVLNQTRGSLEQDCRIPWSLVELRAALRAAAR